MNGTMTGSSGSASSLSPTQAEKRREFSKRQNLRRQVFREVTTFQIFPLQAMAIDDFDKRRCDYFHVDVDNQSKDHDSDESESSQKLTRQRESGVEKLNNDDDYSHVLSPDCDYHLRQQFKREFLGEKAIPISEAISTENIPVAKNEDSTVGKQANISRVYDRVQCETTVEEISTCNEIQIPLSNNDVAKAESVKLANSVHQNDQGSQVRPQFLPTLWSMEPRIFAMETSVKGKRRYISAHLGRFMDHYWRECDVHCRHYYELIRESTPCRLYFDLEFNKSSNPQLTPTNIEDFLSQLFDELRHQFQHTYNITIERSHVVDLDASTPTKFSRHWIVHLPNGQLFSDAREVGLFVKAFVSRLDEDQASGELLSRGYTLLANNLFVNVETCPTDDNPKKLTRIIDLGVYTRNRIFRLLGSTKFGKPTTSALRIAEANEFPFPNGFNNTKFYLPEMGKTNSTCNGNDAVDNDDFERFCNSLSWEDHADAMAATLVVPANSSKIHCQILKDPSIIFIDCGTDRPTYTTIPLNGSVASLKFPRATQLYGPSPFPILESFILDFLGKRGGVVGRISTWSIGTQQPLPRTVCFNMKDNRFCDNIGRAHKSNNIIWNVHLGDRICWQSCHDPECKGYRGNPFDLPEEVNNEIDEYFLEYELSLLIEDQVIESKLKEFREPSLEEAMCKLEISHVAQNRGSNEKSVFDDESLDNELAKLNLSDLVAKNSSRCDTNSSELWKNDDQLDLELAMLNISEL